MSIELNNFAVSLLNSTQETKRAVTCLNSALLSLSQESSSTTGSEFLHGQQSALNSHKRHDYDSSATISKIYTYDEHQYDEGMSTFLSPILIFPLCPNKKAIIESTIYFNLGLAYKRSDTEDQDHEALLHFMKAIEKTKASTQIAGDGVEGAGPHLHAILHNIGHIHWRAGRFIEAIWFYSQALDSLLKSLKAFLAKSNDARTARAQDMTMMKADKEIISEYLLCIAASLNCIAVCKFREESDVLSDTSCQSNTAAVVKSLDLLSRAIEICNGTKKNLKSESPYYKDISRVAATIMNNIGRVKFALEDYKGALSMYRGAFETRTSILGNDHLDVGVSLCNMGETMAALGQDQRALGFYKHFLTIVSSKLGSDHIDVANALGTVGILHCNIGEYEEAIIFLSKATQSLSMKGGSCQEKLAFNYNQLGNAFTAVGHCLESAMDAYKAGLAIERTLPGPVSKKNLSVTLCNIANVAKMMNEWSNALSYYSEALSAADAESDGEHQSENIANILTAMAGVHEVEGHLSCAEKRLKHALQIRRNVLGNSHFNVSTSLNALGLVQFRTGENEMALSSFMESLKIRSSIEGVTPAQISTVSNNVATVYKSMGDLDKALYFYNLTLSLEKTEMSDDMSKSAESYIVRHTLSTLQHIASVYKEKQDFPRALEYYQEAITFCIDNRNVISRDEILHLYASVRDYYFLRDLKVLQKVGNDSCAPAA